MIIRVPDKNITTDLPDYFNTCVYCKHCTEFSGSIQDYFFVECELDKDVVKGCQAKCNDFVKQEGQLWEM